MQVIIIRRRVVEEVVGDGIEGGVDPKENVEHGEPLRSEERRVGKECV